MTDFRLKMKCDNCKQNDLNEVLILRKRKFTKKGQDYRKDKFHRVCISCAVRLTRNGFYDLGNYWYSVLIRLARVR